MNKEIDDLIAQSNEISCKIVNISKGILNGFYKEFNEIPTAKKHQISLQLICMYSHDDDGHESFTPNLHFHKTYETTVIKRKKEVKTIEYASENVTDIYALDFLEECEITDFQSEDAQKMDELSGKIIDFLQHYANESWLEDTCTESDIPKEYEHD